MVHYPYKPGLSERTVRLRSHPQAHTVPVLSEVWVFDCPRCGRDNVYLRHARPLADGTLVCRWCFGDGDAHDLHRCAGCGEMRPEADFAREPLTGVWAEIAGALGGQVPEIECAACRNPRATVDHLRPVRRDVPPVPVRRPVLLGSVPDRRAPRHETGHALTGLTPGTPARWGRTGHTGAFLAILRRTQNTQPSRSRGVRLDCETRAPRRSALCAISTTPLPDRGPTGVRDRHELRTGTCGQDVGHGDRNDKLLIVCSEGRCRL